MNYALLSDQRKDVLRCFGQRCGSVGDEEASATEAPEDRDAGQAGSCCGEDVNVGIAHIDGFRGCDTELFQSGLHHQGVWLARNTRLFSDGNIDDAVEEGASQFRHTRLHLVADHRHAIAAALQRGEQRGDARIEFRMVLAVNEVVSAEGIEALLRLGGRDAFRDSPFDELPHAVAHETPHLGERPLGVAATAQGIVRT